MHISLGNRVIQLAEGRPLAVRGARYACLECTEGMVWLTLEGRPDDYFLRRGEQLRIESDGLTLVEGNPCGAIRLVSAAPRRTIGRSGIARRFEAAAMLPRFAKALAALKFG